MMRRVFNGSEEIRPAAAQEEQQAPVQSTAESVPSGGEAPRRAMRRSMRNADPAAAGSADAPFRASAAEQPPVAQMPVKSEAPVRPVRAPLNTETANVSSPAPTAEKPFERIPAKREMPYAAASAPVQEPEKNQYANMFASWDLLPPTMIIHRVKRGV